MAYVKCIRNLISSTVPDGKTVTPTDDISIWLACGARSETYTTLSQVLADVACLSALINSNNAVDYLVRSKSFAKSEALVPTMTSDTTPSGVCSANSDYRISGYEPFRAFDNNSSDWYHSAASPTLPVNLMYEFPTPIVATKFRFVPMYYNSNLYVKEYKIQASNDNLTWEDLYTDELLNEATDKTASFSNTTAYKYYRISVSSSYVTAGSVAVVMLQFYSAEGICDNSTAMSYIGLNNYASNTLLADSTWRNAICNSTYFESVLNVKVPIMTSNTAPSGEVIFASNHVTGGQPYYVFDGNSATDFDDYGVAFSTTDSEKYIGYQFPSSVKIYCMDLLSYALSQAGNTRTCTLSVQYDNDGWQTDSTLSFAGSTTPTTYKHVFNAGRNSQKFRVYTTGGNAVNSSGYLLLGIATLQFYGRADI